VPFARNILALPRTTRRKSAVAGAAVLLGATGLAQALPGSKMASAGSDLRTNPTTQIKWGVDYMKSRYGSPCGAWAFWQSNGWY
jgi:hypothetical protein